MTVNVKQTPEAEAHIKKRKVFWEKAVRDRAVERRNQVEALESAMQHMSVEQRYRWFIAGLTNLEVKMMTADLNAPKLTN